MARTLPLRRIPVWEHRRRLRELKRFRELVENLAIAPLRHPKTRAEINHRLDDVNQIVVAANVHPIIRWTPPPVVGGYIQDVDVFTNIFRLSAFSIPLSTVIDFIDRGIGNYERDQRAAQLRTYNPLYWIGRFLDYIARVPFAVLGRAGFHTRQLEDSILGRSIRLVVYLLGALAALLTVLQLLGYIGVGSR